MWRIERAQTYVDEYKEKSNEILKLAHSRGNINLKKKLAKSLNNLKQLKMAIEEQKAKMDATKKLSKNPDMSIVWPA